jgi:signal transduction histidine kinase
MSTGQIRFAADILRRLGEELNPSPDQGIIELVKNAYDANALKCHIELRGTDTPGGSLRIVDDGDGMTDQQIIDGWLVLGRSPKDPTTPTRLGRRPAGSKGLGRLAALRMGTSANLTTRPKSQPRTENSLRIDWPKFDAVKTVDEVPLTVENRNLEGPQKPGSEIVLENLRTKIGRNDVKKLARSLVLLSDPFGEDPSGFNPTLEAPEYSDLERLVSNRYFDDADYHLTAELDGAGRVSAQVLDFKGKVLFSAGHEEIAVGRSGAPYACPPCVFDLWVFILTQTSFQLRSTTLGEVRDWLGAFGGVHVYQNGIRVAPYGNTGDDWLELNLRRVRSPEERPSTNTAIGRIAVKGGEEKLVQKTDRSGFIETEAFSELRAFGQDATEWMARRRMEQATKRRAEDRVAAPRNVERAKTEVQSAIAKAPAAARKQITEAFGAYDRSRERESTQLRKEVQLYRTLSTAGITAATFAHESSGNPIKVVAHSIKTIERRSKKELGTKYEDLLGQPVTAITRAVDALSVLGSATLSLIDHDKRRLGRVEVHSTITNVLNIFGPFLTGRDVVATADFASGKPYLRASQAAIESIITNLLNNSLTAFEQASVSQRKILIRTTIVESVVTIDVLDNGPGIEGIDLKDIWLPGETTRPNGTGLGLAIVKDTVVDLGGHVSALAQSPLGGAQISVELPILGK